MVFFIKIFIRLYQKTFSPFLGANCRFHLSCSNNMIICLERFGLIVGFYFGLSQVLRCHPWSFLSKKRGVYYNG